MESYARARVRPRASAGRAGGKISVQEVRMVLGALGVTQDADRLVAQVDTDRDGQVSWPEIEKAL